MILNEEEVGILREDELGSLDGLGIRGLFDREFKIKVRTR